jgi:hypothetical protein
MSVKPIGAQTIPLFDSNGNLLVSAFEDVAVPTANSANNAKMADVLGNKTDTTSGNSVIALLKQLAVAITFQHQPAATLSQATPSQNQYYDILPATVNAKVLSCSVSVASTGETLQAALVIDGQTYTGTQAAVAGTLYYIYLTPAGALSFTTSVVPFYNQSGAIEGRSIEIKVEKTTNAGSGTITGTVQYQKR